MRVALIANPHASRFSGRQRDRVVATLAAAGYHVVAPDMRGYGMSDRPQAIADYDIQHLSGDLVGLVDLMGEKSSVIVGHDWGAIVCWNAMLLHPQRFSALAAMSVPFGGRGAVSPIEAMRSGFRDNFYYILYFQEPGVAEAEFDKDPRAILSRLYLSPDSPRDRATPNVVIGRAADDGSSVIRFISDCDDF